MMKLLRYAFMLFCLTCISILTKAQCTVNAGADYTRCIYGADSIPLHGTIAGNFTAYNWASSGSGTILDSTTLNPVYFQSAADLANGTITLTLTATGGTCGSVKDQIVITVYKKPTVTLQNNFAVCGSIVSLTSTTTNASTSQWLAAIGSGTFSSTTTANTTYTATASDIAQGYVLIVKNVASPGSSCVATDTVRVTLSTTASVNAGLDQTVCSSADTLIFSSGTSTGGFTSYLWTTSGTGMFVDSMLLSSRYRPSAADITKGNVVLTLIGSSATCGTASDSRTVTLLQPLAVSAGPDQTTCAATIALDGFVTPSSGVTLQWSNVIGTGTFTNTAILTPTYTFTAADQTRGYVIVRLRAISGAGCTKEDSVRVTLAPSTSINAGFDQTVCSPADTMIWSYGATTGNFTSYLWTTSGTGTFNNSTSLFSAYTASAADLTAGSVILTLTGSSATCGTASDVRVLTFLQGSAVSAGANQTICAGTTVTLNGTVTPSAGATFYWSNAVGTGTFTGSSTLTPTYTVSAADITRGYALLSLRATASSGCVQEDTTILLITSAPIVFAGSNQVSCSGGVNVKGHASNDATAIWTTSGTGAFANASYDSTIYTPSVADRTSGHVILTYTATNNCASVSSVVQINLIQTAPLINAGIDEVVCGKDTIQLEGSVVNASGGIWTTSGTGHFLLSPSHLVNLYAVSAADKTAGSVSFTLTSYNAGGCGAVSDVRTITMLSGTPPSVNAGADQVSSSTTQLNATVGNATAQLWETSGGGVFTPNPTSVNASYIPSASDITAGSVILTLIATNSCGATSDALTLFTTAPSSISGTVKAGSNTLDKGVVYLFAVNDDQGRDLVGIDTIYPSNNGAYEFATVSAGNYNVYAVPFTYSIYAATYLATYLGSATATAWETAGQEIVTNGSGAHVLNVDLVAYTSALPNWNTGIDTISGAVFLYTPIGVMRLAGTNDAPLAGVVVYLKSLNGQVIAYTSTNKYGMYTFDNVLSGNYYVDPEYSHTAPIDDKIVAVDGKSQTIEDGNIIVNRSYIATGVLSSNKSIQINVYPNPTADNVHMQLPKTGNYLVKVLDETGIVHIEQQLTVASGAAVDLSLAGLNKGMYIIQVTSGDEVYNTKVVKF